MLISLFALHESVVALWLLIRWCESRIGKGLMPKRLETFTRHMSTLVHTLAQRVKVTAEAQSLISIITHNHPFPLSHLTAGVETKVCQVCTLLEHLEKLHISIYTCTHVKIKTWTRSTLLWIIDIVLNGHSQRQIGIHTYERILIQFLGKIYKNVTGKSIRHVLLLSGSPSSCHSSPSMQHFHPKVVLGKFQIIQSW